MVDSGAYGYACRVGSFDRPEQRDIAPSDWVMRFAPLIPRGGRIVDVACGHGRHSRWLAGLGYRVTAVDIDISGLTDIATHPGIELVEADLEDQPWPFGRGRFDGVVVSNYLHRPSFANWIDALTAGGVLIIETFAQGNERYGRPRNPDFLLQPGELLEAFATRMNVVAYEHGYEHRPRSSVRQRLCATLSTEPVAIDRAEP